jgi:putative Mn2+ efflux pump MntP
VSAPLVGGGGPPLAGGLLVGIGVKMAAEGLRTGNADRGADNGRRWFAWGVLLSLGLATSIDAAAVGVSLALTKAPLLNAATIIGIITLACCLPAFLLGCRLARLGGHRAPLLGGLVLIALGVRCVLTR